MLVEMKVSMDAGWHFFIQREILNLFISWLVNVWKAVGSYIGSRVTFVKYFPHFGHNSNLPGSSELSVFN